MNKKYGSKTNLLALSSNNYQIKSLIIIHTHLGSYQNYFLSFSIKVLTPASIITPFFPYSVPSLPLLTSFLQCEMRTRDTRYTSPSPFCTDYTTQQYNIRTYLSVCLYLIQKMKNCKNALANNLLLY